MQNSVTPLARILSLVLLLPVTMVHGQGKKSDEDTRELEAAELKQQGVIAQFGTTRFRPPQSVIGLLLSPDEKYVVTISNTINVWDAESGLEVKKLDPSVMPLLNSNSGYGNRPLVFSQATGRLIGIGRQGRIAEYDPATGETQEILTDSLLLKQSLSSRSDSVLSLDACSGDMYCGVPTIPKPVFSVFSVKTPPVALATPKSITFGTA